MVGSEDFGSAGRSSILTTGAEGDAPTTLAISVRSLSDRGLETETCNGGGGCSQLPEIRGRDAPGVAAAGEGLPEVVPQPDAPAAASARWSQARRRPVVYFTRDTVWIMTLTLTCERATDQRQGAVRQVQRRVGQRTSARSIPRQPSGAGRCRSGRPRAALLRPRYHPCDGQHPTVSSRGRNRSIRGCRGIEARPLSLDALVSPPLQNRRCNRVGAITS